MEDLDNIRHRIRAARKRAALSQQDLANKLSVAAITVSRWERGQQVGDLLAIAKALDVSVDWLATGAGSMDAKGGGGPRGPRLVTSAPVVKGAVDLDESDRTALFELWRQVGGLTADEYEFLSRQLAGGQYTSAGSRGTQIALAAALRGYREGRDGR